MSYTLRRAHAVIWLVIALLVPALLWLSLSGRPTTLYDRPLASQHSRGDRWGSA
jgi:hypothetical protein